jgi:hypothetical protein
MPIEEKKIELVKLENEHYWAKVDSMDRIVDVLLRGIIKDKAKEINKMKSIKGSHSKGKRGHSPNIGKSKVEVIKKVIS